MYTFSPMMVANSRKHHCRVRPYTREVLVLSTNLEIQTKHYSLVFRNRRGDEARIKKTWYNQGEEVSDPDSPAPKPAKSTKPKITKQAKPVAPKPLEAWNVAKKRNLKRISAADRLEFVDEGLTESDTESDKEVPLVVKSCALDEGQARPNPGIQDEGQAGPNPSNDIVYQTLSTPGVHAGPNLEHTWTLSSLQHLAKDFSFGDQFFNDKPSEANNEKATADTEAESMVSVTIHQDTSVIPPMTSLVIDLASVPDSPTMHRPLPTTTS
ncbi:hypothetical protein Tco_1195766 [Tanacetum coccineum]